MSRAFNNMTLVKTVEEIDESAAIEMMSNPDIDEQELSEVLNCHFCKLIKDKDTGEPLQLNIKVVMAGLVNRMKQLSKE